MRTYRAGGERAGGERAGGERAGGEMLEPEVEVTQNKIVWEFEEPTGGGRIRFTLTVDDDGNWKEVGEFFSNRQTSFQFFKMDLKQANNK